MVEEGEVFKHGFLFVVVVHLAEHDLEARVVVIDAALEGVVVVGEHVGLDARDVVDQGEAAEVGVGRVPVEGEVAVFLGGEVEGLMTFGIVAEEDSHIGVVVAEVDAAGGRAHTELFGTIVLGTVKFKHRHVAVAFVILDNEVDQRIGRLFATEVWRTIIATHSVGEGGGSALIHLDEETLVHVDVLTSGSRTLRGTTLVLDLITLIGIILSIGVSKVTIAQECCVLTDKGIEVQEALVGVTKEIIAF